MTFPSDIIQIICEISELINGFKGELTFLEPTTPMLVPEIQENKDHFEISRHVQQNAALGE